MGHERPAEAAADTSLTLGGTALRTLAGVRIGLVGFGAGDAGRVAHALEQVQAFVRIVPAADVRPGSFLLRRLDLLVVALSPALAGTPWHPEQMAAANDRPVLLVGAPDELLAARERLGGQVCDFLTVPLRVDELLLRACAAVESPPPAPEAAAIATPDAALSVPARAADGPAPRVLVADDDATVVALVATTLRNYGIACHVAANGQETIEMARELRPDAVVLDLNMPQLDGFAVLAALRNDRATRDMGVVILSARQQEADILRGFGLGADDYVVKPFNPMELAMRLQRMIRGRRCDAA